MIAAALLLSLAAPAAPAPVSLAPAPALPAQAPGQDDSVPPIQAEGDYYVINFSESESSDEGMNLLEFVKVCQEATGENFTFTQETEGLLRALKVRLFGTKRIPQRDFYRFFQIMMFINEFATIEVGPDYLKVVVIQSLTQGAGRNTIKQKARYVLPEDLDQYVDQPATLITTVVTLPNTDVRQLTTSLRPMMPDQSTQAMLNAGSSDSLILTGFGSNIAHLADLLYIIDEASTVDDDILPVFDVVKLEYADPGEVADIIDQLMEAQRQVVEAQVRSRPGEQGQAGALGAGQAEAKILTDPRTGSLLIMALEDDLPRIRDLVARLDIDVVEPERNYHIYALENVAAEEVAEVLTEFLRDASRVTPTGGTGGRAPGQSNTTSSGEDEIVVVPDPTTNSLLIAANKTRYDEVESLVDALDQRQDQVLIETALIELTGSDFLDIGVELGSADIPDGAGDLGGFGVSAFGLSAFQDTDADGIPDVRIPTLTSGMTAGIIDGDDFGLPVLLAMIETQDNTNVLNVPSVLVNDNGSATVRTLDERPTTTVTATGGVGGQTQENFNGYVESGITLSISPSISASRYLRLGIELEVSTFVGTFSTGTIPPPKVTRTLITEVNVPDGDTMVIGGIVTDNKSRSRQQMPFLGDIPLLGLLFRRQSDTLDRTTLYFFVTPHILHEEDFADLAEVSYQRKLQAAEIIGIDRMRLVDPEFGRDEDTADGLDSFALPLYRSPDSGQVEPDEVGLEDPTRRAAILEDAEDQGEEEPPVEEDSEDPLQSLGYIGG